MFWTFIFSNISTSKSVKKKTFTKIDLELDQNIFFFFFDLLTFYQRRSKVNDTKTLKVVYQANQKEKLLGKLDSLIVSV